MWFLFIYLFIFYKLPIQLHFIHFFRQVKRLIRHMVVFSTIWAASDMQACVCVHVCVCLLYMCVITMLRPLGLLCKSAYKTYNFIKMFTTFNICLIYFRPKGGYPCIWYTVTAAWQPQPIFPLQWLTHYSTLLPECPLDHLQWKGENLSFTGTERLC